MEVIGKVRLTASLSRTSLKPPGCTWSHWACRIGHCIPIWQSLIGSLFSDGVSGKLNPKLEAHIVQVPALTLTWQGLVESPCSACHEQAGLLCVAAPLDAAMDAAPSS
jgi:hypothetical protein